MSNAIPVFILVLSLPAAFAQQNSSVRTFENRCSICHGGDANGSDRAPSILPFFASHNNSEIAELIRQGRTEKGMPSFPFNDEEMARLIAYVSGLRSREIQSPPDLVGGKQYVAIAGPAGIFSFGLPD